MPGCIGKVEEAPIYTVSDAPALDDGRRNSLNSGVVPYIWHSEAQHLIENRLCNVAMQLESISLHQLCKQQHCHATRTRRWVADALINQINSLLHHLGSSTQNCVHLEKCYLIDFA